MAASDKRRLKDVLVPDKKKKMPASIAKGNESRDKKFGEIPLAAKNRAVAFTNPHLSTRARKRESRTIF